MVLCHVNAVCVLTVVANYTKAESDVYLLGFLLIKCWLVFQSFCIQLIATLKERFANKKKCHLFCRAEEASQRHCLPLRYTRRSARKTAAWNTKSNLLKLPDGTDPYSRYIQVLLFSS